jgi:diadenosine tetraphosphate (Ap4A) HIT family hydrolase
LLNAIICADWSKDSARRAAYVAEVATRLVKCLGRGPFTLKSLVDAGARYSGEGSVLVGIDAPLGAPRSLLAVTHQDLGLPPTATFVDWVTKAASWPSFFSRAVEGEPWSPLRPFFRVTPGADARNRMFRAMRERGVEPLRDVDTVTAAKSPFILSGIPGSVGSSVADLWPALSGLLANRAGGVRCWPFDQAQPETGTAGVVLAEIYPRALYASALATEPPPFRARLSIAKGDARCRRAAMESLLAQDWVRQNNVRFEDAEPETITEDSFDALLSAAGLLRCVLEDAPLGWSGSDAFEGGILALDSLNLSLPERTFRCGSNDERPSKGPPMRRPETSGKGDSPFLQRPAAEWIASNDLAFAIPDPFPVSPGHTLVITKRVVPTWFEANQYERLAIVDLIEEVKKLLDRRTPAPDGYNVGFNAGAAAGQTVMHLHVHVIPRYAGDVSDPTGGIRNIMRKQANDPR